MPIFRKSADQAARAVRRVLALSTLRHGNRGDGRIHSVGTARAYKQALTGAAQWLGDEYHNQSLESMTAEQATQYLQERAVTVRQKTLDLDRQALQILPLVGELERVKSTSKLKPTRLVTEGHVYTPKQVEIIARAQTPRNALATRIVYAAGLRASELLTLLPASERSASGGRKWLPERFDGRGEVRRYTVEGMGGLVREVALPLYLAGQLEERRLETPARVTDRGVHCTQHYDLGGGQAWSQSVSAASKRELGWSIGAYGLRYSYAQERVGQLQGSGYGYAAALETVSQELGNVRPNGAGG